VLEGIWLQRDFREMTMDDLLDAHEMLDMKYENARRAREYARTRHA